MAKRKKKKRKGPVQVDAPALLKLFKERNRPLSKLEIMRAFKAHKKDKGIVKQALRQLTDSGKVVRIGKAYGLSENMRLITGKLEVRPGGFGFVLPEDSRRKDVFIGSRNMGGAWHGDRVVAAIVRERKTKNHEGRIVRILSRRKQTLSAKVVKVMGQEFCLCRPTDARLNFGLMVDCAGAGAEPRPGEIVLAAPGDRVDSTLWEARLVEIIGLESDLGVQEILVKKNHSIPTKFPPDVLAEADHLPGEPSEKDFAGREDLRETGFVTIDGASAKDFDDAIYVEKRQRGYRLWVAIADVSHYVRPGSALDREAEERGNSYYFPKSVEPMFPEALSNGLCSLNPGVNRLAMTVCMDFSSRGMPGKSRVFPSVIRSCARLTYGQVKRALLDKEPEERERLKKVLPMLETAEALARKINARRRERGSIDFDLPEPEIVFDDKGRIADIRPLDRHFGHRLIEEFMVSANEAVASFLEERGPACLYRLHPEPDPDKIRGLLKLLAKTDPQVERPKEINPETLQRLLQSVRGSDKEFLVNRMLLRSMMQAGYSPNNEGHFGLASDCYCHFTSPIRRYADLAVHRLAKAALGEAGSPVPGRKKLFQLGSHLGEQERRAMDAEREIRKRMTILFLRKKVGRKFNGVISSLTDFGFWVELKEVMAEGLVRLSSLHDDYYGFLADHQVLLGQRTGRAFKLGQGVKVILEAVNLDRLEVDLILAEDKVKKG